MKQGTISNGKRIYEKGIVKANRIAGFMTVTTLPEENLEILRDPVSPKKQRNWSGIYSSPANTIRGQMRPNACRVEGKELCLYENCMTLLSTLYTDEDSDLFYIAVILFAQGFEKLQIHLRLRRSRFGFALVAARCSCRRTLNFADS